MVWIDSDLADEHHGGELGGLTGGIVTDHIGELFVGEGEGRGLAKNITGEVIGVDDHAGDTGLALDLVANSGGILRQTDTVIAVFVKTMVVEAVQTANFVTGDIVENAALAEKLPEAGGNGGIDNLQSTAMIDGKLHLPNAVNADAGIAVRSEAGKELGKTGELHILLINNALLAQRDDLLADGENVTFLPDGENVLADEITVIFAKLDEMGLDGAAGIFAGRSRDIDLLVFVCKEFHSFIRSS